MILKRKTKATVSKTKIDLFNKKNFITIKLTMADITLPIAKPTWPYPNLKAKSQFNPTFKNNDNKATYIGVLRSCLAKNQIFKILIVMKATKPKQKAFKL